MRWPWKKVIWDLDAPGDVYLTRYFLCKLPWLGVYVHHIQRPDYARCEHDHPWAFLTVILRGGYTEEVGGVAHRRRPGYVGYRPRHFEHRITALHGRATWSLVIRGPDHFEWGFRLADGQRVLWSTYVKMSGAARILWCRDAKE